MKLVIDIPEYLYDAIMVNRFGIFSNAPCEVIRNGKPLPMGKCGKCEYYRNNYGYGQCFAQKNAPRVDYNHSCENFKYKG